MDGYLDEPELTAETLVDGWLHTGDLGWLDASNHLHLVGRSKNMIVTAGGKNVYPEDIEGFFGGVGYQEMAIYASQFLWPSSELEFGELVAVIRAEDVEDARVAIRKQNRRLPDFKRVSGVVVWSEPFPRTASMKLKRNLLADALRERVARDDLEAL
jgi:long-chain acyl-CoA synthetase